MSADETLTADYSKAIDFLQQWCKGGPWVLVAIDPNKKGIEAGTFGQPTIAELRAWLEDQGTTRRRNLYFGTNPCVRSMKKKPERVDIAALAWLHVDIDPEDPPQEMIETRREALPAHYAAERARIFDKLRNLPDGIPPPTCIIDSGGGYQAFWRLRDPLLLDGKLETAIEAAGWNKQLELRLGGDNCFNVDRIMRLPGSLNRPDPRKAKKGRVLALASLVEFNDSQHAREGFEKSPAVAVPSDGATAAVTINTADAKRFEDVNAIRELQADDDPRNAQCRVVIALGNDPDNPDKFGASRSEWLLFACCQMLRAGCSDDAIYSVITDPRFGISASVLDKGSGVERYATRQVEEARKKVAAEAEEFQKDKDGKPYKNLHNARVAVRKLGVTLEFDEFAERSFIAGLPGFGPQLDDAAVTRMRLDVEERFRIPFGKDWFADFIADAARRNRRHPVREFLDGLTWDKTPRLDGWMTTFLGVEDTEYTRAIGTLVLVAAVRRIRQPGCKFDEMLVLEGEQGSLKSTALKVLAVVEDWFSDDLPLNAKSQQFIEQTVGKWIVEAGELKGMRRGDIESLKSCLSRSLDRARMAYGRLAIERPRQFVIIGTTNSERYLKDSTGNRRFWPVRVGAVKLAELRREREQLWAEAAEREAAGASIRLDPSLYDAARAAQEERRVEDPWVQVIADRLGGMEGKLRTADAWLLVNVTPDRRTQQDNERLGEAMRELGWERVKLRFGGEPEWAYVRGDARARRRAILPMWEEERSGVRVLRFRLEDEPVSPPPPDEQADVVFGQEGTAARREER